MGGRKPAAQAAKERVTMINLINPKWYRLLGTRNWTVMWAVLFIDKQRWILSYLNARFPGHGIVK